ncbi:MAG: tetratricopeptide repeat protein [Planctomycetes bacterium]|nr:tetratricopeptide repeat protein [Planctomycetota bacterium]
MNPRIAVIPFSTGPNESRAALTGRGLALELIEWLRGAGLETVLLTATHTDDDGGRRALVAFSEPLDAQTIADIVALDEGESDEEPEDITQAPGIQTVISGSLRLTPVGLAATVEITDTVAVYSKGSVEGELVPGNFFEAVQKFFNDIAQQAGLDKIEPYDPGTKIYKAWEHMLLTRAYKLAAELGVLDPEIPQPYKEPLAGIKLDPAYKTIRDRAGELALTLVIERGFDAHQGLKAMDEITRATGHDWKSWRVRAQLLSAAGKHAESARTFVRLVKGDNQAPEKSAQYQAALDAGREFNAAGKHDDAVRLLQRAMESRELKVDAIVESGSAYAGLNAEVVAERLWQRALELDSGAVAARLNLAHHYRNKDDTERAAKEYAKLLEVEGLPRDMLAEAAEFFFSHQLYDTAVAAADQFAREYPGDPIAHVLKASAFNALGRHPEAINELNQAELCAGVSALKDIVTRQRRYAEHPDSEKRLRELADFVFGEEVGKAEEGLRTLVKDYPDFWEASMLLGITLRRQERWEDARVAFEQARTGRDVPGADKELTGIYSKLGQPEKALECAKRAFDSTPDDAEIVANYAAALLESGEMAEAYKHAKRAEELDPEDAVTRKLLDIIESKYLKRGFVGSVAAAARYLTRKFRRKKPKGNG